MLPAHEVRAGHLFCHHRHGPEEFREGGGCREGLLVKKHSTQHIEGREQLARLRVNYCIPVITLRKGRIEFEVESLRWPALNRAEGMFHKTRADCPESYHQSWHFVLSILNTVPICVICPAILQPSSPVHATCFTARPDFFSMPSLLQHSELCQGMDTCPILLAGWAKAMIELWVSGHVINFAASPCFLVFSPQHGEKHLLHGSPVGDTQPCPGIPATSPTFLMKMLLQALYRQLRCTCRTARESSVLDSLAVLFGHEAQNKTLEFPMFSFNTSRTQTFLSFFFCLHRNRNRHSLQSLSISPLSSLLTATTWRWEAKRKYLKLPSEQLVS